MKRIIVILAMLLLAISSFAVYNIGDVSENISWTTSNGESTSIYDQVDAGKPVMIFWGTTG